MFIREMLRVSNLAIGEIVFFCYSTAKCIIAWLIWECRAKWRVIIVFWRLMHARL